MMWSGKAYANGWTEREDVTRLGDAFASEENDSSVELNIKSYCVLAEVIKKANKVEYYSMLSTV